MEVITKDSPEWHAALEFAGKWRANCPEHQGNVHCSRVPDITDDLLYAILEAGENYVNELSTREAAAGQAGRYAFLIMVFHDTVKGHTLADAIIYAATSLQEAKS